MHPLEMMSIVVISFRRGHQLWYYLSNLFSNNREIPGRFTAIPVNSLNPTNSDLHAIYPRIDFLIQMRKDTVPSDGVVDNAVDNLSLNKDSSFLLLDSSGHSISNLA